MKYVVKLGGAGLQNPATREVCARAIAELVKDGNQVALVHGGGVQLTQILKQMGKQVANGECAMMAMEAIKAADAKPMQFVGKTYIWGRRLDKKETVLPGDIVQMEDCKFKLGWSSHHSQIVRKVLGPGRYEILEQNVNGRRTVGTAILDLSQLLEGEVAFYRPLPK